MLILSVKTVTIHLKLRTYERGVEDETLSCGTGAVAAAIALNILSLEDSNEINLKTKGGLLNINLENQITNTLIYIYLEK